MTGLVRDARSSVYVLLTSSSTGSFLEFLSIMSILVKRYTPATLPYRIIIHSLPGYTFSSPTPLHRDLRIKGVAAVVNMLMVDLRFGSGYVAQGGDIGSKVSRALGAVHPECKGKFIRTPFNTDCPLIESLDSCT
jgi:microsomal epoxide hydrolase